MNNSSANLPDRNLPDELLVHILSYLPTKHAVTTSILSKRWKCLWTYVDTLEFDFKFDSEEGANRALQQLHLVGLIKRMRLALYEGFSHDTFETAIFKNVETLHLHFRNGSYKWPHCLLHSQTLVELKLACADMTNIDIPTAPFFPNLKKLYIHRPDHKICLDSLNRLISGCSILEYLNLDIVEKYKQSYHISSATLKTVSFYCSTSYSRNPKVVLNTPALEVLQVQKTVNLELLVKSSMPSLHKAEISIRLDKNSYSDSALNLLEFLSNVSALRCKVQSFYSRRSMIKSNLHAYFDNLTRLEIIDRQFGLDLLRIFIERSNNLKAITMRKWREHDDIGVTWEEPQKVPKCLLSSLQSIGIYGYHSREVKEVESLIKYILENAKVLKRMEVGNAYFVKTDDKFKNHMLQKISMFPRASINCEISFK